MKSKTNFNLNFKDMLEVITSTENVSLSILKS